MKKFNYLFINQELLDMLNKLGYVHFVSKEQVKSFKEGKAFYFCKENKEYGFVDVVPYCEVKNIEKNIEFLKDELCILWKRKLKFTY